ncbi:polysaccharide deacetylase family protein [Antarcticibacterium sp. 1MA-6-2]|uniref:polysaccharide deacetylase family protein n=1 Tax=Antarcticibacterium sp. 1MA-6-2 TaxID=2908210 RepID=UPI001F2CD1C3|nr:polysaccharide deacetylase family protein [Antarcticibacterium sp. 1MA-6-2]UJH93022.1 polysaccharide deacetylase family protein [Antarcticibacterium sp. 1MA-6-2]
MPNAPSLFERTEEWKDIAEKGHELGNHSVYHPCRKSRPGREWVPRHHDLDEYSLEKMVEELTTANTFLKALDGKTERTFTPPCGDLMAGIEKEYIEKLRELFIAYKGQGTETGFSVVWAPNEVSGRELIDYIKNLPAGTSLVNIIFHGVGGDYLTVSSEAHEELLQFLANNSRDYYVDTYFNIMKYANTH